MNSLEVSTQYGILVRRGSLSEHNVPLDALLRAMEVSTPLDMNEDLISFGPSFGEEALREFIRRLEKLGFTYSEDFFDLRMDHPEWCKFRASLK